MCRNSSSLAAVLPVAVPVTKPYMPCLAYRKGSFAYCGSSLNRLRRVGTYSAEIDSFVSELLLVVVFFRQITAKMKDNLDELMKRDVALDDLEETAGGLAEGAKQFHQTSKKVAYSVFLLDFFL